MKGVIRNLVDHNRTRLTHFVGGISAVRVSLLHNPIISKSEFPSTSPSISSVLPTTRRTSSLVRQSLIRSSRRSLCGDQLSLKDFITERAQANADKLGVIDSCEMENKVRIGVCGNSAICTSELVLRLGETGNEMGFDCDQKHHEIVGIHLSNKVERELLRDEVSLLADTGCRLILIPESDLDPEWISELNGRTKGMAKILCLNPDETIKQFSERALKEAAKLPAIDPNLHDASSLGKIAHGNFTDYFNFQRRMASRMSMDGGYPRLADEIKGEKIILIIGGAGPVASATCAHQLAQMGVLSMHYSVSSAPSKIKDVLGDGLSCVPHYIRANRVLRSIFPDSDMHTIIPCNTFHFLLKEVFSDPQSQVIDIRDAVASHLAKSYSGKVILLGTEATVFGASDLGEGLYDEILTEAGCEIIKPSREQQDIISEAINVAKAGKMTKAKSMIDSVVQSIRSEHGGEATVGLLCTDLPIAYTPNQIPAFGGFSSITALVQMTRDIVFGKIIYGKDEGRNTKNATAAHRLGNSDKSNIGIEK